MNPETKLERLLHKLVRQRGGMSEKLSPNTAGTPDRLVLMPGGKVYLVELKTLTGRLSPAQVLWHSKAAARGTEVITLYGEKQIRAWVDGV